MKFIHSILLWEKCIYNRFFLTFRKRVFSQSSICGKMSIVFCFDKHIMKYVLFGRITTLKPVCLGRSSQVNKETSTGLTKVVGAWDIHAMPNPGGARARELRTVGFLQWHQQQQRTWKTGSESPGKKWCWCSEFWWLGWGRSASGPVFNSRAEVCTRRVEVEVSSIVSVQAACWLLVEEGSSVYIRWY